MDDAAAAAAEQEAAAAEARAEALRSRHASASAAAAAASAAAAAAAPPPRRAEAEAVFVETAEEVGDAAGAPSETEGETAVDDDEPTDAAGDDEAPRAAAAAAAGAGGGGGTATAAAAAKAPSGERAVCGHVSVRVHLRVFVNGGEGDKRLGHVTQAAAARRARRSRPNRYRLVLIWRPLGRCITPPQEKSKKLDKQVRELRVKVKQLEGTRVCTRAFVHAVAGLECPAA